MYMFSCWLFFVRGGLPASWPTQRISLTGYRCYHLSTTTKSTIYGTLGAVLLWLYIRRPQAVSFNLWHDMLFPSYKNVYMCEIYFGKHLTTGLYHCTYCCIFCGIVTCTCDLIASDTCSCWLESVPGYLLHRHKHHSCKFLHVQSTD